MDTRFFLDYNNYKCHEVSIEDTKKEMGKYADDLVKAYEFVQMDANTHEAIGKPFHIFIAKWKDMNMKDRYYFAWYNLHPADKFTDFVGWDAVTSSTDLKRLTNRIKRIINN